MNQLKYGLSCCVVGRAWRTGINGLSEVKILRFPKQLEWQKALAIAVRRQEWGPNNHNRITTLT